MPLRRHLFPPLVQSSPIEIPASDDTGVLPRPFEQSGIPALSNYDWALKSAADGVMLIQVDLKVAPLPLIVMAKSSRRSKKTTPSLDSEPPPSQKKKRGPGKRKRLGPDPGLATRIDFLRSKHGKALLGENRRTQLYDYAKANKDPSVAVLIEIARATGCNGHWLLLGDGPPYPESASSDPRTVAGRQAALAAVRRLDVLRNDLAALEAELATLAEAAKHS